MMKAIVFCFVLVLGMSRLLAQDCFQGYDKMFANGNDTLSAAEFKVVEQQFISNLQGCMAPDFSGTTIDNEAIFLSGLHGKLVVLNFWFIHCPPCLKEIPLLNSLTEKFDADEVVFIGLARDDKEQLESFFDRYMPFKYKIIPESYLIADAYKVVGWPQSMIIDKQGRVYKTWAGTGESAEDLVNDIQKSIETCLYQE